MRGAVGTKVKNDFFCSLVVVEPPLDHLADRLDPLPHALARHAIEEGGERVEEVGVLREVVEML